MTTRRPSRKSVARACLRAALALGLGLVPSSAVFVVHAATTQRVVTDRNTGLAIYGIDPVAYFTEKKPTVGRAEFELRFAGAIWRFDNEGNRAAFVADPTVYMPQYGGYDPLGIARGITTPGYPQLWAIVKDRLYLFYTADARAAFMTDPAAAIKAAEARWSAVMKDLSE
jgi:hypothetical protein